MVEAGVLLAEEVVGGDAAVVEEQLGGVVGLQTHLLQAASRLKPGVPDSTTNRLMPCAPSEASVFATTMTRSASSPLVMTSSAR